MLDSVNGTEAQQADRFVIGLSTLEKFSKQK